MAALVIEITRDPDDRQDYKDTRFNDPVSSDMLVDIGVVRRILQQTPRPVIVVLTEVTCVIKTFVLVPFNRVCSQSIVSQRGVYYTFSGNTDSAETGFERMVEQVVAYAKANRLQCSPDVLHYIDNLQ